jgi:hypothetical protein
MRRCRTRAAGLMAFLLLWFAGGGLQAQHLQTTPPPTSGAAGTASISDVDVERIREFLHSADVVDKRRTKKGITAPRRLTLSDGRIEHDAVFQTIDEFKHVMRFDGGRIELNFRDTYHFNIAAFEVAHLLGISHMVPVSIERRLFGEIGSLSWWVTWKWDEQMRVKEELRPPNGINWRQQWDIARVFGELVYDTDRNQTNMLITEDWKLWMIDFSRAFRRMKELRRPEGLRYVSRSLLERLRALDGNSLRAAAGDHLGEVEIEGLLARRDLIVQRFDRLIAERGEERVLFD